MDEKWQEIVMERDIGRNRFLWEYNIRMYLRIGRCGLDISGSG
jgi:hypothetical protein